HGSSPFPCLTPATGWRGQMQFAALLHFLTQPERRDIEMVGPGRHAILQLDPAKEASLPQRFRSLAPLSNHPGGVERAECAIGKCHHQPERDDGHDAGELEASGAGHVTIAPSLALFPRKRESVFTSIQTEIPAFAGITLCCLIVQEAAQLAAAAG